jgi:hypothetical protein
MAIRNDKQITLEGPHVDAVELPEKRWKSGACFVNPNGTSTYICLGSPIHYNDGTTWQPIDTRWQAGVSPWTYEMTACQYQAFALSRFDAGQILRLEKGDHYLTYQPMAINWANDLDQIEQVAMPANVQAVVANGGLDLLCPSGRLDWKNGYGMGLDFSLTPSTHYLKKLLSVNTLANLGTPAAYIIAGGNPVLELSFVFSSDLDLWIDGKKWDKQTQVAAVNNIEFKDLAGAVQWWWRTPTAVDANGEVVPGTIQVKKQGASLYVSVLIPYAWLQTATYPVHIDPDVYYGETTDGHTYGYSNDYATAHSNCYGYADSTATIAVGQASNFTVWRGHLEFDTSGIDDAKYVIQANLYLKLSVDSSTTDFTVRVHDFDWASPMSAGTQEANYDGALASVYDADWQNSAGLSTTPYYSSGNLKNSWVKKGAGEKTRYVLISEEDVNASQPANNEYLQVHSQNAAAANRPYLSITVSDTPPIPPGPSGFCPEALGFNTLRGLF